MSIKRKTGLTKPIKAIATYLGCVALALALPAYGDHHEPDDPNAGDPGDPGALANIAANAEGIMAEEGVQEADDNALGDRIEAEATALGVCIDTNAADISTNRAGIAMAPLPAYPVYLLATVAVGESVSAYLMANQPLPLA